MRALAMALLGLLGAVPAVAEQWLGFADPVLQVRDLERLLAEQPLAANENIKVIAVARTAHSAQLLVQVRDREPLHFHADSDLTVFLLRGRGSIRLGTQLHAVRAGDILHIPRGQVHAYINGNTQEPGVAFVVYSPPPGPHDRVRVPEAPKNPDAPLSSKDR